MQNQYAVVSRPEEDAQSLEDLRIRAQFYQLLAGAFIEEPGRDYLAGLRSPETMAALTGIGVHFGSDFLNVSLEELVETLSCEYSCLFIVSGGCPPVESVRLTGRLKQAPFLETSATYKRCGFDMPTLKFSVFEDHLGAELLFVATLLESQAAALECGKTEVARRLEREVKRFWALHLGRWVRGYSILLERMTGHSFFREMARMLRAFAEEELNLLKVNVDDLDGGRVDLPKAEVPVEFNPEEPVCNACEHGKKEQQGLPG